MNKTKGRPAKDVSWPEGCFTPRDVLEFNESKVSTGLVHLKIKKALLDGTLEEVGKKKSPKGRPASIYSKKNDSLPLN
jgi:hypothetical protein